MPMKPYYEKLRELRELPLRHLITLCGFYRVSADVILGLMDEEA